MSEQYLQSRVVSESRRCGKMQHGTNLGSLTGTFWTRFPYGYGVEGVILALVV